MDFKNEGARLLFLKYALPCGYTLVKRGVVEKKLLAEAIGAIGSGRKVIGNPEKTFDTALDMCKKIAKKSGKRSIDNAAVRKYFLFEHDRVVNRRYNLFKDFDSLKCRTYSGMVVKMKSKEALVKTVIGENRYRTDFYKSLKKGDCVVVHRSFIIEKISERMFKRLWKLKENYFKSNKSIMIA